MKLSIQELRDEINEDIKDYETSISQAEVNIKKEQAWIEKLKGYIAESKKKLAEYEGENICEFCHGTGTIVTGKHDDIDEKKCFNCFPKTEEAMDDDSDNK